MTWCSRITVAVAVAGSSLAVMSFARVLDAQPLPLAPSRESGQTVTPAFEGWYKNPDGSYSLAFGYFNRNTREVLEIPVSANNFMSPADSNQGQPTRFEPGRHWGVFAVRVPADFGEKTVTWTVAIRGEKWAIPGSLKRGWEIDALAGEAGSGNTPPVLRFSEGGSPGAGPGGIYGKELTVAAGQPLTIDVWATDDGRASGSVASAGRTGSPVTLRWFKHQGEGTVTFAPVAPAADRATGKATTTATFSAPGVYVLKLRVNDASGIAGAGHSQCCWSNGFVKVTVTR
jgi:hypothetical protein